MGFRGGLSRSLVLTVLAILVGGVAALLWANLSVLPSWMAELNKVSEGQSHTLGAYYRPWK